MQVTLKQSEIEVALKNYIQAMGINLAGKSIDVAFTAGRKEAGISAELDINETGQPQVFLHREAQEPEITGIANSKELRPAQEFRPSLVSRAVADNAPVLAEVPTTSDESVEPESLVLTEEVAEAVTSAAPKVSLFG